MKITVIIPTMNEEESIGGVLDSIPRDFADVEILIVDTNSKDRTVEIAKAKGARVINEPRRGYGRAYKTGFEHAEGDIIATLDGDGTYPAEDIPRLVEMLKEEELDFISCDRLSTLDPKSMSLQHRIGNWVLAFTTNLLFGMHIRDSQSGMWIFKRQILPKLVLKSDGMALSEEIKIEVCKKGFRFKEVPIKYRERKGEVKLNTWRDGSKNFFYLFKKRFLRKYNT